jgi:hypothetical protein
MQQVIVCALVLSFSSLSLSAQEKPLLRAKLELVETAPPPPPLKVALNGKALERYLASRAAALEHLASRTCSKFLKEHSFDAKQVSRALAAQHPQDGAASEITLSHAGISDAAADPQGDVPVSAAFKDRKFLTMAVSQPRGVDSYYNRDLFEHKNKYPYSLPISVIHEALHNLTGESDVAIAQDFGYHGFNALEANIFVNDALKKNCDSKR